MTLAAGDLTTPLRASTWMAAAPTLPSAVLTQLIGSMTALIYNKLNRARLYSQTFTRIFDGLGTYQIVLPDWPVTSISSIQMGAQLLNDVPLPSPTTGVIPGTNPGYGYRFVPWAGNLPGDPVVLEFVNGNFCIGQQNIKVTYTAGYLISGEAWTVPATAPYQVTVLQPQGIWCRDNGVVNATTGATLTPVVTSPASGQYIPPPDSNPGLYTFNSADAIAGLNVLISYSFIPADLEEACIQMIAERYAYRTRVGEISKTLGGQESVRYLRGGMGRGQMFPDLPPEVEALITPYVSTIPPAIGAPV